eukprot:TRINITY_DN5188_c0_g3_i2.p1 TRINITY_DN5188_c0_g3~~TRINITY_DN5188_c0_g3_i2.p1  ORF type:complete len:115 (-),score=23.98 TRINITY_DN5188_c0_g3_i2:577-921(-)
MNLVVVLGKQWYQRRVRGNFFFSTNSIKPNKPTISFFPPPFFLFAPIKWVSWDSKFMGNKQTKISAYQTSIPTLYVPPQLNMIVVEREKLPPCFNFQTASINQLANYFLFVLLI